MSALKLCIVSSRFVYNQTPYPSCHASTIVQSGPSKLMAAWFGGTRESHPDVRIYGSVLEDGAWSEPRLLACGTGSNGEPAPCYNPVLFKPTGGPLLLFYKAGTGPGEWQGYLSRSNDDGETWSSPSPLPPDIYGPIKNKPIETADGTVVCPSSTEDFGWRIHFEFTKDFGFSWSRTEPLNDGFTIGAIQPSLLKTSAGKMVAVGRTRQGKLFHVSGSSDGCSWGPLTLLDVPNPNSGTDALTLSNGLHLLAYNPSETERTPLSIAVSTNTIHWKRLIDIETEPGEYSYPSVTQSSDGTIHVVYTWNRQRIRHVELSID
jgi:predicted neuraminidase